MHVISYRRLREFSEQHADCREVLDSWFKVAAKADWLNLIDVQSIFPLAEAVGNFTIFNIKGNKYRLIASIDYERQLIFIKYVLTHAEYDKEKWKSDPYF
jgi:mRNA interferase HigB